jgi:hypothetical protein
MGWTYPTKEPEAPIYSGVISRSDNGKRGRGKPNLTWKESAKRDLNNWCITKELASWIHLLTKPVDIHDFQQNRSGSVSLDDRFSVKKTEIF